MIFAHMKYEADKTPPISLVSIIKRSFSLEKTIGRCHIIFKQILFKMIRITNRKK